MNIPGQRSNLNYSGRWLVYKSIISGLRLRYQIPRSRGNRVIQAQRGAPFYARDPPSRALPIFRMILVLRPVPHSIRVYRTFTSQPFRIRGFIAWIGQLGIFDTDSELAGMAGRIARTLLVSRYCKDLF